MSGYGEGQEYVETITVTTSETGDAGFVHVMTESLAIDRCVTVTATDPDGNTSEFSRCEAPIAAIVVNAADDLAGDGCTVSHCSLREAITARNDDPDDPSTIVFAIPGDGPHTIDGHQRAAGIDDANAGRRSLTAGCALSQHGADAAARGTDRLCRGPGIVT